MTANRPAVLVTRAREQQSPLVTALAQAGYDAAQLSAVEITRLPAPEYEVVAPDSGVTLVFTSANAVQAATANGLLQRLLAAPASKTLLAIGPATARALEYVSGQPVTTVPHPHTSESLLAMPLWQHRPRRHVVLIKGVGGRGKISSGLQQRGFNVCEFDVYRRDVPRVSNTVVSQALLLPALVATIATSNEILENLVLLAQHSGKRELARLQKLPLIVCSGRARDRAASLGFSNNIHVSADPSVDAIVDIVKQAVKEN